MGSDDSQRDYVVPAMIAAVSLVAIVAAAAVGLALAFGDGALLLVGAVGTIVASPVLLALIPLIKSVNRTAVANEATAEGVESIKHSLNGGFEDRVRRAVSDAVEPLRDDISELRIAVKHINQRLEKGDQQFDQTGGRLDGIEARLSQITSCEAKPAATVPAPRSRNRGR